MKTDPESNSISVRVGDLCVWFRCFLFILCVYDQIPCHDSILHKSDKERERGKKNLIKQRSRPNSTSCTMRNALFLSASGNWHRKNVAVERETHKLFGSPFQREPNFAPQNAKKAFNNHSLMRPSSDVRRLS